MKKGSDNNATVSQSQQPNSTLRSAKAEHRKYVFLVPLRLLVFHAAPAHPCSRDRFEDRHSGRQGYITNNIVEQITLKTLESTYFPQFLFVHLPFFLLFLQHFALHGTIFAERLTLLPTPFQWLPMIINSSQFIFFKSKQEVDGTQQKKQQKEMEREQKLSKEWKLCTVELSLH